MIGKQSDKKPNKILYDQKTVTSEVDAVMREGVTPSLTTRMG